MCNSNIRIQLAEPEILIAMDIERVLTEVLRLPCVITFNKCVFAASAEVQDLVVCAIDDDIDRHLNALRRLSSAGSSIVILTTLDDLVIGGKPPWPCVQKPYNEQTLVEAISSVLKTRCAGQAGKKIGGEVSSSLV